MTDYPYHGLLDDANAIFGAEVEPLAGGHSGETFLVRIGGEELVLRLYARDPDRAEVDATLLRLLRGLLPVADVLEVRGPREQMPIGLLLTSKLPGRRLDLVLAETDLDDSLCATLGRSVGEILGRLSCVPFLAPGRFVATHEGSWISPTLSVETTERGPDDVVSWAEGPLYLEPFVSWPDSLRGTLYDLVRQAVGRVDWAARVSLVHGDLDPANVLVDPVSGAVTGLLDWERAHAGRPISDLGNLLRSQPGEVFINAAAEAYRSIATGVPADVVETARAIDLLALTDLATRPSCEAVRRARWMLSRYVRAAASNDLN